ncbi:MAG: hypothetical protein AAFU71_20195, partial [Cyanobacteria bacterium J06632_22]
MTSDSKASWQENYTSLGAERRKSLRFVAMLPRWSKTINWLRPSATLADVLWSSAAKGRAHGAMNGIFVLFCFL